MDERYQFQRHFAHPSSDFCSRTAPSLQKLTVHLIYRKNNQYSRAERGEIFYFCGMFTVKTINIPARSAAKFLLLRYVYLDNKLFSRAERAAKFNFKQWNSNEAPMKLQWNNNEMLLKFLQIHSNLFEQLITTSQRGESERSQKIRFASSFTCSRPPLIWFNIGFWLWWDMEKRPGA